MNDSYPALLESVSKLADALHDLNRQAAGEYAPLVESILRSQSRDLHHIEQILDGLLGFCGYEPALLLYRKLCRYYFDLDPAAAVSYVNAYREMWDTESEEEEL